TIEAALKADEILALQKLVRSVPIAEHVRRAVARLSLMTQPSSALAPARVKRFVRFGLSPRGAQSLVLAAKAQALIAGRYNVAFDDIEAVLLPATRHRVQLNFEGIAENVDLEGLVTQLFQDARRDVS